MAADKRWYRIHSGERRRTWCSASEKQAAAGPYEGKPASLSRTRCSHRHGGFDSQSKTTPLRVLIVGGRSWSALALRRHGDTQGRYCASCAMSALIRACCTTRRAGLGSFHVPATYRIDSGCAGVEPSDTVTRSPLRLISTSLEIDVRDKLPAILPGRDGGQPARTALDHARTLRVVVRIDPLQRNLPRGCRACRRASYRNV